jgi:hypothetical protein
MEIPQPTIHSKIRIRSDGFGVVQGGSTVGTVGELSSLQVPSHPKNNCSLETSSGSHTSSERYKPSISLNQPTQTPVRASREPSASKTLLVPQDTDIRASTTDRDNSTRSTAYRHPTNTSKSFSPAFLPTPPPESHPSLPQCAIPEFDFREFQRSEVYPYGVETPGLVHKDDYFGK